MWCSLKFLLPPRFLTNAALQCHVCAVLFPEYPSLFLVVSMLK